jgi:hypothetical protein
MTKITFTTDCKDEAKVLLHAVEKSIAIAELRNNLRYKLKDIDFGDYQSFMEELYKIICEIDSIGE